MSDRTTMLLEPTRRLALMSADETLPVRLCRAAAAMTGAGHVSLCLADDFRTVLAATTDQAQLIEEMQDLADQGPTLDALAVRETIRCSSADGRDRWPLLWPHLDARLGPSLDLLAVPLTRTAPSLGALTTASTNGPLSEDGEVDLLAQTIALVLLDDWAAQGGESRTWSARDRIDQATGMVIAQLRLDASDALAVLRAHAFASEVALDEVAGAVLARELDFSDPGPAPATEDDDD